MLTPRQRMAAQMLAGGATCKQTADAFNVTPTTVSVWRRVEEFRQEIANNQAAILAEARARLLNAATGAIDTLSAITLSGSEEQRVQAAKAILNQCKLTPSVNDFGIETAIGRSEDLPDAHQVAVQAIEAYQAGYTTDAGWIEYLEAQDLLEDQEALQALTEDSDFLSRTLSDYRQWVASQQERSQ